MLTHKRSYLSRRGNNKWRKKNWIKRADEKDPADYINSIGQPKGTPNKFNTRDEVKLRFELILIWITKRKY